MPPRPSGGNGGRIAAILGGVAVVLIAVGVGAFFLFSDGGDSIGGGYDNPRDVAQAWVDREGEPQDLVCAADLDAVSGDEQDSSVQTTGLPSDMPASETTLKSVDVASGSDSGTFTMEMTMEVLGTETSSTATYDLVKEDGGWKVCGILAPDIEVDTPGY
ncbi:hypothetical protein ABZV91_00545 [Nocardia sp. NPDC004568]|uniref:Rv0361 family membrane protein n=1 Tax=Nocardia sp. NPDC004568 TaxID=3154551 RepID=UPI0033BFAF57